MSSAVYLAVSYLELEAVKMLLMLKPNKPCMSTVLLVYYDQFYSLCLLPAGQILSISLNYTVHFQLYFPDILEVFHKLSVYVSVFVPISAELDGK